MAREKTRLEKYEEIQALVRKDAKEEAEKVYNVRGTQYGVPKTPYHTHNGIDSALINENNILLGDKLNTQLFASNPTGDPDSETLVLRNVPNVSRISFHGFAANNASGPASQRAVITGEIIFGRCYTFTGTGPNIFVTTNTPGEPFRQACDFMFTDTADIENTRVGTAPVLAFALNSSASPVATMTLLSYTNNALTFQVDLGPQFTLQGNIIIE